jgi:mRNA-degrading endonuclease RelE of RelBE toxin-antitoxin system
MGGQVVAIDLHLRHEPRKVSKSRIKRLRGLSRPQFRLRMGEIRVFYDVSETSVEVLAIVAKPRRTHGSFSSEAQSKGSAAVSDQG